MASDINRDPNGEWLASLDKGFLKKELKRQRRRRKETKLSFFNDGNADLILKLLASKGHVFAAKIAHKLETKQELSNHEKAFILKKQRGKSTATVHSLDSSQAPRFLDDAAKNILKGESSGRLLIMQSLTAKQSRAEKLLRCSNVPTL